MIDDEKVFERVLEKILTARPPEESAKALIEARLFFERKKVRSELIETLVSIRDGRRIPLPFWLKEAGVLPTDESVRSFIFQYPLLVEQRYVVQQYIDLLSSWNKGMTVLGELEPIVCEETRPIQPYKNYLQKNAHVCPDSSEYYTMTIALVFDMLNSAEDHAYFGFGSIEGMERFFEQALPRIPLNTFRFWFRIQKDRGNPLVLFKDKNGKIWSGEKYSAHSQSRRLSDARKSVVQYHQYEASLLPVEVVTTLLALRLYDLKRPLMEWTSLAFREGDDPENDEWAAYFSPKEGGVAFYNWDHHCRVGRVADAILGDPHAVHRLLKEETDWAGAL